MSYVITVRAELTEEFLSDVICTMVESGYDSIWYWGAVTSRHMTGEGSLRRYTMVRVAEDESHDDGPAKATWITLHKTAKAIERLMSGEVELGSALRPYLERAVRDGDAGDIDATVADCIAQVVLFGEIVYG